MENNITSIPDTTDSIVNISKAMSEYGVAIVIIATFVVVFIVVIGIMIKNNNKHFETMHEQNELLLKTLVDNMNGSHDKKEEPSKKENDLEPRLVGAFRDISLSLKNICKGILDRFKCDRVSVYVFHNGNQSAHGLPFFKLSCIGEWNKRSNTSRSKIHSELPLYLITDVVEALYNDGEYVCENRGPENKNDEIERLLNDTNVKSIAIFQIVDEHNNLAGFTMLEYFSATEIKSKTELKNMIKQINGSISGIITDSDLQDKLKDPV